MSESIGMNDQIVWNTQLRIPDRIARAAEINCNPIPKFAAGYAGTIAGTMILNRDNEVRLCGNRTDSGGTSCD